MSFVLPALCLISTAAIPPAPLNRPRISLIYVTRRENAARFSCRIAPNMVSRAIETTGFCPIAGHGRKGGVKAAL
jgi:hypothetical protein